MPTNFPKHALERAKKAYSNTDALAEMAGGIQKREVANLVHDIRSDIHMLTVFAQYWQGFCRETGHNPYAPYGDNDE